MNICYVSKSVFNRISLRRSSLKKKGSGSRKFISTLKDHQWYWYVDSIHENYSFYFLAKDINISFFESLNHSCRLFSICMKSAIALFILVIARFFSYVSPLNLTTTPSPRHKGIIPSSLSCVPFASATEAKCPILLIFEHLS